MRIPYVEEILGMPKGICIHFIIACESRFLQLLVISDIISSLWFTLDWFWNPWMHARTSPQIVSRIFTLPQTLKTWFLGCRWKQFSDSFSFTSTLSFSRVSGSTFHSRWIKPCTSLEQTPLCEVKGTKMSWKGTIPAEKGRTEQLSERVVILLELLSSMSTKYAPNISNSFANFWSRIERYEEAVAENYNQSPSPASCCRYLGSAVQGIPRDQSQFPVLVSLEPGLETEHLPRWCCNVPQHSPTFMYASWRATQWVNSPGDSLQSSGK